MTLATFVRTPDEHAFAGVVVDQGKIGYLWPTGSTPPDDLPTTSGEGDDAARLQEAATALGGRADPPFDQEDGIGDTVEEARRFVQQYLDSQPEPGPNPLLGNADDAYAQVVQDYPGIDDAMADPSSEIDPAAIDQYAQLLMGPIDPEGEDGWVFRAVDGQPREGDEDQYLHLPTVGDEAE